MNKCSSNYCGGFKPAKGHLDTQMFPECEGYETDRNIVGKHKKKNKKKKKKSFNLKDTYLTADQRLEESAPQNAEANSDNWYKVASNKELGNKF